MTLTEILNLAIQRHKSGDPNEAERICRQILAQAPAEPHALNLLGIITFQRGDAAQAANLIAAAAAADPASVDYLHNLVRVLESTQRWLDAAAVYRKILTLRPNDPAAHNNLGLALHYAGRLDEAAVAYRAALKLQPDNASTLNNLGGVIHDAREAIACFHKALQINPNLPQVHCNLANALTLDGQLDESVQESRRALALQPNLAGAYNNLGQALFAKARIDDAMAAYKQAETLDPQNASRASNRLFALQFHPAYDSRAILRENVQWSDRHAQPLTKLAAPHTNDPSPDRRLRVGYISPNLCLHSQAPFIYPLLKAHDRAQVEVYLYSDTPVPDAITAKLHACADVWRTTTSLNDQTLADLIRADQIDILIDLTMHMARGRPLVMARKPAPVQVTWLAYPGTTGLSAIDYRFTDDYLDPPGIGDDLYIEKSIRLPQTFACFDPAAMEEPPPLSPPPAQTNGYITFGSLNNFFKMNQPVLDLWSKVLAALPTVRLRLLAPQGEARPWVLQTLPSDRVDFVPRQPRRDYLAEFARIDIALDTLPYNGHTTTLEGLWMGVPIITRRGPTAAGRAGWSVLNNLQLSDLAAADDDQFVQIAVQLANDLPRLLDLRQSLRQRMLASPVTHAKQFAENVETAYRRMWKTHLGESLTRSGNDYCIHGDWTKAIDCYRQSQVLRPDHYQTQNNLANALAYTGQTDQAIPLYNQAFSIAPNSPDILRNLARAHSDQNHPADAIATLDKLLAIAPDDAAAHVARALAFLVQGDFPHGLPEYEWRGRTPELKPFANATGPIWNGSDLSGRRILLHAEQGLGDALQCARFLPEVARRGGRIILAAFREMKSLLEGIAPVEEWILSGDPLPNYDVHCPLLSLPLALGTTVATIPNKTPYLAAPPAWIAHWKSRLPTNNRLKVGLCWAGRPTHTNDRNRSMPPTALAPLTNIPHIEFFSLQKGPAAQPPPSIPLTDWTSELNDLSDTAALIANLDLVICVDTVIAHLAAALGKPVWLLLPFTPDWRWMLNRPDSPWYPSMRLFRQPRWADWQTPIAQIANALKNFTPQP